MCMVVFVVCVVMGGTGGGCDDDECVWLCLLCAW